MQYIYHLVVPAMWQAAAGQAYRADSLATEGFIHCSHAGQVAGSANRFYADARELSILVVDPARLTSVLKNEVSATGELFPHVYGPINRDAVVEVRPLQRGADGLWVFVG